MGKKRKINDAQPKPNDKTHDPLIGRRVEKDFAGQGKFGGYITGFLPKFGFYKVVYDDGDKEELERHEVQEILVDSLPETPAPTGKKRRTADKDPKSCTKSEPKRAPSTSKRQRKEPTPKTPDSKPNDLPLSATKSRPRPSRRKLNDEETTWDSSTVKEANANDVNCTTDAETVENSTPQTRKTRRQAVSEESDKLTTSARKSAKKQSEKPELSEEDDDEQDEEDVSSDVDEASDYEAEESKEEEENDDLLSYSSSDEAPSRTWSKPPPDLKLPDIVPLPESSNDFDLAEDIVADMFAIYSFLRSFSLVLFLSPFSLQDFACGLICEAPNNLVDSIHLVLLQALRRHLHRLSDDGKIEAKECLRERDWNMLDNVTWPSFLVVLLHTQKFGKLYGHRLKSLGLLDFEYYKVPLKTKLNALGFLCDQVMETEEIRAVIDAREWEYTSNSRQKDKNTFSKLDMSIRNQGHHPDMAKDDTLASTQQMSASADSNSDECVLCGMTGNLLCCDGCPGAYHSRCVGTSKASLPPGDWFCPECVIERSGEHSKRVDGLTGGRKLGIDPYGRSYIVTCGYLLVIEASNFMQCSYKYYKRDEIPGVLQSLDFLKPYCNKVSKAIRQYWGFPELPSTISEDGHSLSNIHDSAVGCEQHSSQDAQISVDLEQVSQNPLNSDYGQLTVSGDGKVVDTAPVKMDSDVLSPQVDAQDSVLLPSISEPSVNNLLSASPVLQISSHDQPGCDMNTVSASDHDIKPLVEPVSNLVSEIVEKLSEASSDLLTPCQDKNADFDCENKPILVSSKDTEAIVDCETKPNVEQTSTIVSDNVEKQSGGSVDFVITSHDNNVITAESQIIPKNEGDEITLSSQSFQGFASNPSFGPSIEVLKWGHNGSATYPQEDVQNINQKSHSQGLTSSLARGISTTEKVHVGEAPDSAVKRRSMTPMSRHICFQGPMSYVNLYALGDAAATAAANLTMLSGDRNAALKSKKITINSTIAEQLNAFQKAPSRFYWPSNRKRLLELPKERCGWCYSCTSNMKRGCLLNQVASQLAAGAAAAPSTIRPTKAGDGHLPAVAGYILYIEDVIQTFLQGPWENLHFRKFWRKKLEHAASVSEVKLALLDLESNLRHVVLTEDWSKRSEDAPSLIMVASTTSLLNESIVRKASNRKRNHKSTASKRGSKTNQSALGNILWVRRGKVAHRVSGWATLSNEVLRKAARRGGLKKISGITYLEGDEVSKRSKQCAWRARVQASVTISELALHVRCLDTLFRWNDLISRKTDENENADNRVPVHDKTCKGSTYSYLVDSGIIQVHGSRQNALNHKPASKDDEIWVDERQVPLSILKDYEEHERQSNQSKAPKLAELQKRYLDVKRSVKINIFKHLFEKDSLPPATKLVISLTCKLCKQKVSASMAVQCNSCKEPFHEECTIPGDMERCPEPQYSCSACLLAAACHAPKHQQAPHAFAFRSQSPHVLNSMSHTETPNLPQYETPTLPQYETPASRTEKLTISRSQSPTVLLTEKSTVSQNQTQVLSHPVSSQTLAKPSNPTPKTKDKNGTSNVYWRKFGLPSRMTLKNNLIFPIEYVCSTESPRCFICQKEHMANVLYIKCENCPLWFHAESVGINKSNVGQIMGFKCHKCRKKGVPECPYGVKAKKQFRREGMTQCITDLTISTTYRPSSEDTFRAKRTPLLVVGNPAQNVVSTVSCVGNPAQNVVPSASYGGNPAQNFVSPAASYMVKQETHNFFPVGNYSGIQPPVENPVNDSTPMMHQNMEGQYHVESVTEFVADEFQNCMQASMEELPSTVGVCEVGCVNTVDVQELSGTADNSNADMGVIQAGGSFEGGNISKLSFSFTELLSSEDDRVEQMAGFPVMDVDNDGFDVFDVDTLMGSYGGPSVCPDATVPSGYSTQPMAVEGVEIKQNVSTDFQTKLTFCAVCYDGSVPCDVQCIGCGVTIHQQCLSAPIASGIWTSHGWACNNCKGGFIQDQDGSM